MDALGLASRPPAASTLSMYAKATVAAAARYFLLRGATMHRKESSGAVFRCCQAPRQRMDFLAFDSAVQ